MTYLTNCYECGRAIENSQPILFIDDKSFHKSCAVTLQCYECRKIIGYQVKGETSPNRIICCPECASHKK